MHFCSSGKLCKRYISDLKLFTLKFRRSTTSCGDVESISPTFYEQLLRVQRSRERKKLLNLTVFFALLGSAFVKAACRILVKLTPDLLASSSRTTFQTRTNTRIHTLTHYTIDQCFSTFLSRGTIGHIYQYLAAHLDAKIGLKLNKK